MDTYEGLKVRVGGDEDTPLFNGQVSSMSGESSHFFSASMHQVLGLFLSSSDAEATALSRLQPRQTTPQANAADLLVGHLLISEGSVSPGFD